ncbi:TonB-dependent outer membrane colicin I receptor [Acetobacter malorum]|uniref:TonB-dependent outer membrane colicin I receptor n=1 Tax=Acetobacter malorum TaxID=178901 RepID=A0A177G9I9_9PROT|nr:TonB-dependent outer membrane colicin I receptor [Acetobacter malorum]
MSTPLKNIRPLKGLKLRMDVMNLFDERYQIRNGSGLGVFMSQYGQRRAGYLTTVIQF